jgi:hypothetical protein
MTTEDMGSPKLKPLSDLPIGYAECLAYDGQGQRVGKQPPTLLEQAAGLQPVALPHSALRCTAGAATILASVGDQQENPQMFLSLLKLSKTAVLSRYLGICTTVHS